MKTSEKPTNRVDQLFKNKLDDHTIAPSENAWARVDAGLSKKNNIVLWRWAAAILLMGVFVALIYWSQRGTENTTPVLAGKKTTPKLVVPAPPENIKSKEPQVLTAVKAEPKRVGKTVEPSLSTQQFVAKESKEEQPVVAENQKQIVVEKLTQDLSEEKIKTEATPIIKVASTQQKPIKLEFTLEALPSEEKVATATEVKTTGLKKVLELARDMKQGEGPLVTLRDKKNELFAHTFNTKKDRTQ